MCLGKWSQMGFVKLNDIKVATMLSKAQMTMKSWQLTGIPSVALHSYNILLVFHKYIKVFWLMCTLHNTLGTLDNPYP